VTPDEASAKVVRMLAAGLRWSAISYFCEGVGLRCYIRNKADNSANNAEIIITLPRSYYAGDLLNHTPYATVSVA
jgi:hypothetical protein